MEIVPALKIILMLLPVGLLSIIIMDFCIWLAIEKATNPTGKDKE